MRYKFLFVSTISLILFFIPFFWFKQGELPLGGDSNRLYFYNPSAYLKSYTLFNIDPEGIGKIVPSQYLIVFTLFLIALKSIFQSSLIIINIFDGIKLAGSFIFVYLLVTEILNDSLKTKRKFIFSLSGILAGLFYVFSPSITENMKYALLIHNQVFLNPLILFLLLRFLKTKEYIYLCILLLITFIFSPNFTLASPPPLFSFYPLAFLFIYFYVKFCLKKEIFWKGIMIGFFFLVGLQLFHTIPSVLYATDIGSALNNRIISRDSGINYFESTRIGFGKVSIFLLLPTSFTNYVYWAVIFPVFIIFGFFLNKKVNKFILLTFFFFIITLLLISANITNTWISIYRALFYIPGFSMFRNFLGQWQFVFSFFYALLIGQSVAMVFIHLKDKYVYAFTYLIIFLFIISSLPFIEGKLVNVDHVTTNVSVVVKMDPKYEKTLSYISSINNRGKMLLLPLNDFLYQVVHGINNGAYIGASTVANVAGMPSYTGYQSLDIFGDEFLKLAKTKNYPALKKLLSLLDIKYIFHNSDPRIYDSTFSSFPYGLVKQYLPNDQRNMSSFAQKISDKKIYDLGFYKIYELDNPDVRDFYIPKSIALYNSQEKQSFFEKRLAFSAYLDKSTCPKIFSKNICLADSIEQTSVPILQYEKINSTKYVLKFSKFNKPFLLIFSNAFHSSWKTYATDNYNSEVNLQKSPFINSRIFETLFLKSIPENRHFIINGYANAWYIFPDDLRGKNGLIIETKDQTIAYVGEIISLLTFILLLFWGSYLIKAKIVNK